MNAFDNGTETRATVLVAYPIQDGRELNKKQNGLGLGSSEDPSYTLDQTGAQSVATSPDVEVRRLTPVECERLQGFPDNWTEGLADSHRYKQMGNAVTVNVANYVGLLIMEAASEHVQQG